MYGITPLPPPVYQKNENISFAPASPILMNHVNSLQYMIRKLHIYAVFCTTLRVLHLPIAKLSQL